MGSSEGLLVESDSIEQYKSRCSGTTLIALFSFIVLAILAGIGVFYFLYFVDVDDMTRAQRLLKASPLIDGHNDLPYRIMSSYDGALNTVDLLTTIDHLQTDIPKLKEGHLGAIFWAAYVSCSSQLKDSVEQTIESIDIIRRINTNYPEYFEMAYTAQDVRRIFSQGKIASMIGVEGGHSIDSSMYVLRVFYEMGARYMTLSHNCDTPWSQSCCDGRTLDVEGLTEFGMEVVKEMNRLGMMVDISHVSDQTMNDALDVSTAPIIFSHSGVRALCNVSRNVPDEVIDRLPENGGIIMVNFVNHFLSPTGNATIQTVIDHIKYIRDRIGVDHIGLGSDFDGVCDTCLPVGLEDNGKYIYLIEALVADGSFSDEDIIKITGANLLRVYEQVEIESKRLKQTEKASEHKLKNVTFPDYYECKTISVEE
eukprot:TRINITY_DN1801_c0_g1_i4.p1 TRINITY_DN1801_c0_g1~~TRINITY_DN1801_c0_g1_i4.p1  ORF type:complete len:424 (-),score=74.55 TRINITY_DN1801_c0_g1_i4:141-1412(-)